MRSRFQKEKPLVTSPHGNLQHLAHALSHSTLVRPFQREPEDEARTRWSVFSGSPASVEFFQSHTLPLTPELSNRDCRHSLPLIWYLVPHMAKATNCLYVSQLPGRKGRVLNVLQESVVRNATTM